MLSWLIFTLCFSQVRLVRCLLIPNGPDPVITPTAFEHGSSSSGSGNSWMHHTPTGGRLPAIEPLHPEPWVTTPENLPPHRNPSSYLLPGETIEDSVIFAQECHGLPSGQMCIEVEQTDQFHNHRLETRQFSFYNFWTYEQTPYRRRTDLHLIPRPADSERRIALFSPEVGALGEVVFRWNPVDTVQMVQVNLDITQLAVTSDWLRRAHNPGMELRAMTINWSIFFTDAPDTNLRPLRTVPPYRPTHDADAEHFGVWTWTAIHDGGQNLLDGHIIQRALVFPREILCAGVTAAPGRTRINAGQRQMRIRWTVSYSERPFLSLHHGGPRRGHNPPLEAVSPN